MMKRLSLSNLILFLSTTTAFAGSGGGADMDTGALILKAIAKLLGF